MKPPRPGVAHSGIPDANSAGALAAPLLAQPPSPGWLLGEPGLPGRVALSWGLAGGLSMEAVLVMAALVSGSQAATADPVAVTLFFLLGVLGGFVHGALVGVVGRPDTVPLARALKSVERAVVVMVPLTVPAWVAALWISLTAAEAARGRLDLLLAMGAGWVTLVGVGSWALWEGRTALRHTLTRWPLGLGGALVLALMSASLLVWFVGWQPEIWFTDVRTTPLGAAILALGVTVWFGLPILVLGLRLLHRRLEASSDPSGADEGPA